MPTAVVSGRVDEKVRDLVSAQLKLAGTTTADIIKVVWDNIAQTGEIPAPAKADKTASGAWESFMALRKSLAADQVKTPTDDDWFCNLTTAQMRDMIAQDLLERYEKL